MKKIIPIIIFACIYGKSIAQGSETDFRERLLFGIKAGLNYSNVYDSKGDEFQTNPKFGLAGGAFLSIPIGKYFGLQPEFLISQKGFKSSGRILNNNYNMTRTTNYIDIPLLFTLKPSEFLSIVAGPQYSHLISKTDVFTNETTTIEQQQEFKNDNIRTNTLCFVGGLDINLKHFVLGARIGWDVQNNVENGPSTTPRYKNVWGQGTLGYRFYSTK